MFRNKVLSVLLFVCSHSLLAADSKLYYWLGRDNTTELSNKSVILPSDMVYPRDSSFPLLHTPHKAQYIPRQISQSDSNIKLFYLPVMVPSYYIDTYGPECKDAIMNLVLAQDAGHGAGFIDKYQTIKTYFDNHNISYNKPAKTIIEGGNIHLIDEKKAIIGVDTLLINFLTMDDMWPKNTELKKRGKLYYTARNFDIAVAKLEANGPENFRQKNHIYFLEALSNDDKLKYEFMAEMMDSKIDWVENQIAKEISLPIENIIYIPQRKFHIDLDMTVTPENKILLRAPLDNNELVIYKLQLAILNKYFPGMVIEAPAHFSDPYIFNGILFPESKRYIFCAQTNDNDREFVEFLTEKCGYSAALALKSSHWQEIKKNSAGIHCVTQQYFESTPHCAVCKSDDKVQRCSRCKKVFYCSTKCQKQDWPQHKEKW